MSEEKIVESDIVQIWKLIAKSTVFQSLDRASRVQLVDFALKLGFSDGDVIITEGDRAEAFYLLLEGKVEVYTEALGEHQKLAELEHGAFFGEMGILKDSPCTASIRSIGESRVIRFARRLLEEVLEKSPQAKEVLMKAMAERSEQNVETEIAALTKGDDD